MNITLHQPLVEWTNIAWPALLKIGGLGAIRYRVVERLPFGSDAYAMTWRGEVLVRREWIQPALDDLGPNNELSLRHLWAVSVLAWHEPLHVLEQSQLSWPAYLLRYVWQWVRGGLSYRKISEEVEAYSHQAAMSARWVASHPMDAIGAHWNRPTD